MVSAQPRSGFTPPPAGAVAVAGGGAGARPGAAPPPAGYSAPRPPAAPPAPKRPPDARAPLPPQHKPQHYAGYVTTSCNYFISIVVVMPWLERYNYIRCVAKFTI